MGNASSYAVDGPLLLEQNSAGVRGGGLYGLGSTLSIAGGSAWLENQAGYGGGLPMINSTISMSNFSEFSNNTTDTGGAVIFDVTSFLIEGPVLFRNNPAAVDGGGNRRPVFGDQHHKPGGVGGKPSW